MLRTIGVFALVFSVLGCNGGKDDDRFSDYIPPEDVFCAPLDPDRLITSTTGARFPVDEVILRMSPNTPAEDVAGVVSQLAGTLIGQIPPLGIYQVRVTAETEADLRTAIDTAATLPGVLAAYENALATKSSNDACFDEEDDNFKDWNSESRCALTDIQYFSLVPIMAEFEGFSPVRVTNLEYIHLATGQFDDVPTLPLFPITTPADDSGHGTGTGGIMAADPGDQSIGGVASTVLDGQLELVLTPESQTLMDVYSNLLTAIVYANVRVVNMSFAWSTVDGHSQQVVTEARNTLAEVMQSHRDVIFVSAAGNEATEITEMNYAPGGIQEPNHITVGGTAKCDPLSIWRDATDPQVGSNFGPLVDIAAPGERVPLIGYYPAHNFLDPLQHIRLNGTSFATPLVASLGAILLAIEPTLTGEDVKGYILEWTYGAATNPDGLMDVPRLLLAYPVQQLLLDIEAPGAQELFDPDHTGETGLTSLAVSRICGGSSLDVDTVGTFLFPPDGDSAMNLYADSLTIVLVNDEVATASLAGPGFNFTLGDTTPLTEEFAVNFSVIDEQSDEIRYLANSIPGSGGVTLHECTITERDGLSNMPMMVEVSGTITGELEAATPYTDPPTVWDFESHFTLPMVTFMAGPELQDTLEHLCVGGIQHGS
jgi:Subtilase family